MGGHGRKTEGKNYDNSGGVRADQTGARGKAEDPRCFHLVAAFLSLKDSPSNFSGEESVSPAVEEKNQATASNQPCQRWCQRGDTCPSGVAPLSSISCSPVGDTEDIFLRRSESIRGMMQHSPVLVVVSAANVPVEKMRGETEAQRFSAKYQCDAKQGHALILLFVCV